MIHKTIAFLLLAILETANAQTIVPGYDAERLMRLKIKSTRNEILTTAMHLSEAEGRTFWPLYREFENEISKLNDRGFELLGRFNNADSGLSQEEASKISLEGLRIEKDRTAIRAKYFRRMSKSLSPKIAARFLQVDAIMHSVVAIQIAMNTPAIE